MLRNAVGVLAFICAGCGQTLPTTQSTPTLCTLRFKGGEYQDVSVLAEIRALTWKPAKDRVLLECAVRLTNSSGKSAWYLDDLDESMRVEFDTSDNGVQELPARSPFLIDRDWPLENFRCLEPGESLSLVKSFEFLPIDGWLQNGDFGVMPGSRVRIRISCKSDLPYTRIQANGCFVDMVALAERENTGFIVEFESEWSETMPPGG